MDLVVEGFAHPDGSPQSSEAFEDDTLRQVFHDFAASAGFTRYLARVMGAMPGAPACVSRRGLRSSVAPRPCPPSGAAACRRTAPLPATRCRRGRLRRGRRHHAARLEVESQRAAPRIRAPVCARGVGEGTSRRRWRPTGERVAIHAAGIQSGRTARATQRAPRPSQPRQGHPPSRGLAPPGPRELRPIQARRTRHAAGHDRIRPPRAPETIAGQEASRAQH